MTKEKAEQILLKLEYEEAFSSHSTFKRAMGGYYVGVNEIIRVEKLAEGELFPEMTEASCRCSLCFGLIDDPVFYTRMPTSISYGFMHVECLVAREMKKRINSC